MFERTAVSRGAFRNSLIVMAGFVLSRASGLLRDMVILAQFGTSAELGAYRAAFKLPDLLYLVVIGGALGSTLIPLWLDTLTQRGERRAWELASAAVGWALLLLALCSAVLALLAGPLVRWLYAGPGFDAATLALTEDLTRLFLLSPLLLGLGGLALALLNALDRFLLPALAPTIYNLGILAGALAAPALPPERRIWALAWGVIGGALLYLLVQIPGLLRAGMRLRPTLGRGMAELGLLGRQLTPRLLGQTASQINVVVTAVLVARLPGGAERLVGNETAYQLMLLPYGVFALSLSTVAFPTLARLYASGQHEAMARNVRTTLATICLLTIPAAVGLMVLGAPLVRLLFERGSFDARSTVLTVAPLLGYASALPAFAVSEILIRSFYAMQDTRTPVAVGLGAVGLNLLLGGLAFSLGLGVVWIALAFSLVNNLEALLLALLLGRRRPGLWADRDLWRSLRAAAIGSLALLLALVAALRLSSGLLPTLSASAPYSFPQDTPLLALWLLLACGLGALLYGAVASWAGASEVRRFAGRALGRLRRRAGG
jgi:putative peptidoglycan lipid II flippase